MNKGVLSAFVSRLPGCFACAIPTLGIPTFLFGSPRKVCYLREICEPLFKPGDLTVELLKADSDRSDRLGTHLTEIPGYWG